jgi:hypothetical protein
MTIPTQLQASAISNVDLSTLEFDGTLTSAKTFFRPLTPADLGMDSYDKVFLGSEITELASEPFNYAVATFVPTTTSAFTFKVSEAVITGGEDTFMLIYDGAFDPSNPLANLLYANDDTEEGVKPAIQIDLTAGKSYIIVMTSFMPGGVGSFSFQATGPGAADSNWQDGAAPNQAPIIEGIGSSGEVIVGQPSALPDFTVSDTDGDELTVTLMAANGTINGLTDTDNNATNGIQLTGTTAQINGQIANATFTAEQDGPASISVSVSDGKAAPVTGTLNLTASTPDTTAPQVASIVRANGAAQDTTAGTLTFTVTFDEAVTGVTADDFTIAAIGTANGQITGISGSGTTYTVTISSVSGDGTLRLDLNGSNTGIVDGAANAIITGFQSGQAYTIDNTVFAPSLALASDTGMSESDSFTRIGTVAVSGLELGASWEYSLNGGASWTAGSGSSFTLSPGLYIAGQVQVRQTDAVGNTSDSGLLGTVVVDTTVATPTLSLANDSGVAGDLTANSGVVTVSGLEIGGAWEYTLNGGLIWMPGTGSTIALTGEGPHVVQVRQTDAAGNLSAVSQSLSFTLDTVRPTVAVQLADTNLSAGETTTVTFSFSEAPEGFSVDDITVENGTLSNLTRSLTDPKVYTAIFTPTASIEDATNVITVGAGWSDAAGNAPVASTPSINYTIDTLRPTATITLMDAALKVGESTLVTLSFSEAVSGLTLADLTVEAGTLSGLSSSDGGRTWTATFTPTADLEDTSNVIRLDNSGVVDGAGNPGMGTTDSISYAIDTRLPDVTISLSDTSLKAGETATVTFTFSEVPFDFTDADVSVSNGTLSNLVVSPTDPKVYTATFTPAANGESMTNVISVGTGWTDAAGNAPASGAESVNYVIDTKAPAVPVLSLALDGGTNGDGLTNSGTVVVSGLEDGAIWQYSTDNGHSWTTGTGASFSVTGDKEHDVVVRQTDLAGNTSTASQTLSFTLDTGRPTVAIALSDTSLSVGEKAIVTFTFSEVPLGFTVDDVKVENSTLSNLMVSPSDPKVYTAILTPMINMEDASNLITVGTGWSDAAGNAPLDSTISQPFAIDTRQTDGVDVVETIITNSDGSPGRVLTIPVVTASREEQAGIPALADIPLVTSGAGTLLLLAQLPVGYGLQVTGSPTPKPADTSLADLIRAIRAHTDAGSVDQALLTGGGSGFLQGLSGDTPLIVQTVVVTSVGALGQPLVISGTPAIAGAPQTALVIDARGLPAGAEIQLENVEFATVIGNARVIGGTGSQIVWGDSASQYMVLGADDDVLHGGGGDDYVGSHGGNDWLDGDEGNDTVSGGEGADHLFGGVGHDLVFGGAGRDRLDGGEGKDRFYGGTGHDTLLGGAGNDLIRGEAGKDWIRGGLGRDKMWGGAGADIFDFDSIKDSRVGVQRDAIHGFQSGVDRIDLRTIDANGHLKGNQAFTWVSGSSLSTGFTGHAGELRFASGILMGDVDGNGRSDFQIRIIGSFAAGDVLL